jgi:hypothetical protein
MKKEYRCLASPKTAFWTLITLLLFGSMVIWSLSDGFYVGAVIVSLPIVFSLWWNRNAFSITHMDREGIHNRHIAIRWEEIEEFKLFDLFYRDTDKWFSRNPYATVVGIGSFSDNYFYFQSTKKAVFFTLSKKNLEMIEHFCENKNEAVEDLVSWKNFMMKF